MIPTEAKLLCMYVNASHHWLGKPLYQAVVETARSMGVAGASVFLVDLSYGTHRRLRDARSEYLFVDIPVVVELVDSPSRIDALVVELGRILTDGLTTLEPARVIRYTHHASGLDPAYVDSSTFEDAADHRPDGEPRMPIEGDVQKVTVYVGSADTWNGRNLAMAIVERCRRAGMAGATASLGVMGFGKHSVIHRTHFFGLSEDVPEKVEIVDRPDRIAAILPDLEEMVEGGLIIIQDVRAVCHGHHPASSGD